MKAAIIYSRYLNKSGNVRHIGGIETYLYNLATLCKEIKIEPIIFQLANKDFERTVDDIRVIGIPTDNRPGPFRKTGLFKKASQFFNVEKDIVIFGADRFAVSYDSNRCVSIQHGIPFDLPNRYLSPAGIWRGWSEDLWKKGFLGKLYKLSARRKAIHDYEKCPNRVCVDYNFINWYRTFLAEDITGRNWVIPNFAEIPPSEMLNQFRQKKTELKILFARRFHDYRGTRIMAQSAKSLLEKYPNISFTFAGEGPDETWIRTQFINEPRVNITKYTHDQITDIHLNHHIAVIPSIASEGTSLSVAEAMACGCAVVASEVGGITNMIINRYNGLLCMPNSDELECCIEQLINDKKQREHLSKNAYSTAKHSFSKKNWVNAWKDVLEKIRQM